MKAFNQRKPRPVALSIAGVDSGGGAGVAADLKTFAALGVHGTCAVTCLTAQNPVQVVALEPCPPRFLRAQLTALFAELPPAAIKTGMLFSRENIRVVTNFLRTRRCPLVVDPVMVSTSGSRLLKPDAERALLGELLPLATLVTPNLDETAVLLGSRPESASDLREAAREIHRRYGCAALVKGGHLGTRSNQIAVDFFFDGSCELMLKAQRVTGITTHGTGCTYAAAICAALAWGNDLATSVRLGKTYITHAIAQSYRVGNHWALGPGIPITSRVAATGRTGTHRRKAM